MIEKKSFTFFLALTAFILIVGFLKATGSFNAKPPENLEPTGLYICPANGWVNCMPILNEVGKRACSPEAVKWYKANCPNFQGIAQ